MKFQVIGKNGQVTYLMMFVLLFLFTLFAVLFKMISVSLNDMKNKVYMDECARKIGRIEVLILQKKMVEKDLNQFLKKESIVLTPSILSMKKKKEIIQKVHFSKIRKDNLIFIQIEKGHHGYESSIIK